MTARAKLNKLPEAHTLRLKSLHIENYKRIDNLELQFHGPRLPNDPNVTVIGSENGLGKTSILECCALLFLSLMESDEFHHWWPVRDFMHYAELSIDPFQLMVRAGYKFAKIRGTLSLSGEEFSVSMSVGGEKISVEPFNRPKELSSVFDHSKRHDHPEQIVGRILSLLGVVSEPMIFPPFMYFNSYRKIQEGNSELGMMMSGERQWRRRYGPEFLAPLSTLKVEIVRALMGRQGLFERVDEHEAEEIIQQLNALIAEYAHGGLAKLRDVEERAVELRVQPLDSKSSYPFDGLSSGQKEIISTLFLIWKYTRKQPGVVLIDEPELHLNAQWHRGLVRQLAKLQPLNQYIIATHSEHVFDSVDKKNRLLLQPTENK